MMRVWSCSSRPRAVLLGKQCRITSLTSLEGRGWRGGELPLWGASTARWNSSYPSENSTLSPLLSNAERRIVNRKLNEDARIEKNRRRQEQAQLMEGSRLASVRNDKEARRGLTEKRIPDHRVHQEIHQQIQRKNVVQSIPYWLRNNPDCFERTMEILELSSLSGKENPTWAEACRKLYLGSIPSFLESLLEIPPAVAPALDKLVEAGFANIEWAAQHENCRKNLAEYKKYIKQLNAGHRSHRRRKMELKRAQAALREIQAECELQEKLAAADVKATSSFQREGMMARATDTKPFSRLSNKHEVKSVHKMNAQRLEQARIAVQREELAVATTKRTVQFLEIEMKVVEPDLTEDEYEQANLVVNEALVDICQAMATHMHERHEQTIENYRYLETTTDITKPHEWYPDTRLEKRKIIFHGGPTNSGKTYTALQRLKVAQNGVYLAPLRLLAAEIYEELTSQGIRTNLLTGHGNRLDPFATHTSATVEIANFHQMFEVAVIDEIQMLADQDRGYAWTRAMLGIRCKELHVCGGLETQDLVKKIAESCGDDFEMHSYERFCELTVATKSLATTSGEAGTYKMVQPGDCVVAFSIKDIAAIKGEIESTTNYKCCMIYGSLPPEIRIDQARRFNDPDSGFDILIASDAIGMGLNLSIRRIIFHTMFKTDGQRIVRLSHSSVKQISGRAGRRNSPFPQGEVTCRDPQDMEHLRHCMATEVAPIVKAGLRPTVEQMEQFSEVLQRTELVQNFKDVVKVLAKFREMATLDGDYFLCSHGSIQVVSRLLRKVDLTVSEKLAFCMAPLQNDGGLSASTFRDFAQKYSTGEIADLNSEMIPEQAKSFDDFRALCANHNRLQLVLWLQRRFPGTDMEVDSTRALREETVNLINEGLADRESLNLHHSYLFRDTKLREKWTRKV